MSDLSIIFFLMVQDGEFPWPERIQGLVLGSYFWGYILTQMIGGRIAELFSAKWVIWASVFINVIFTLATPIAAHTSYNTVLVVRGIEGLAAVSQIILKYPLKHHLLF